MDDILKKLELFDPITLEEMDHVKLLDRLDTKYTFRVEKLPFFLDLMKEDYRILETGGTRTGRYYTKYFDTKDFSLYLHHHNGKMNRFKIRYRKYLDTDITYFEVKFKRNTGRMIKKRLQVDDIAELISGPAEEFLQNKIKLPSGLFFPVLDVYFSRMTFVNRNCKERLTVDTDLHYRNPSGEISFPNLVIAETKQDKTGHSFFSAMMDHHQIRELPVSKYCLGIASLVGGIKKNNFKYKISQINKTDHGIK